MMDVSQFIDSPEMREYLKTVHLSERTCEELVRDAPRPLVEKVAWLEQNGSEALAEESRRALKGLELKPGEFLYLRENWYDDEDFGYTWGASSGVPFYSLDAAVRYIRQEMAGEEWNGDFLCWAQLDKWLPGEDGVYCLLYTYYLFRGEVVYFDGFEYFEQYPDPFIKAYNFCGAPDLNIPIPFHPGDIVTIDCRPLMPRKPVVLLEADDSDCCGVTCLFRREEDGNWEVGNVKHSRCWAGYPNTSPYISPLYRLATFQGELEKDERLIGEVSKFIDGDAKKGQDLWEDLNQEMNRLNREWLKNEEICSFLG